VSQNWNRSKRKPCWHQAIGEPVWGRAGRGNRGKGFFRRRAASRLFTDQSRIDGRLVHSPTANGGGHGTHQSYDTPFVFVGNNRYAVAGLEIGTRATLDGGKLRVWTWRPFVVMRLRYQGSGPINMNSAECMVDGGLTGTDIPCW
jgi:hypothetical protein